MNLRKTVLLGSLWAVGMRWGIRGLGMISLVVLARLLRPEDFGILAMAMILVAALAVFTEVGVSAMLIRDADVTREDMDTAWTIRIVQGVLIGGLVAALAHPMAAHFDEPRMVNVVYVCALALAINSFENIGVVMIRKELDFAKDFRYQIYIKTAGVVATIALAFWLRNYWALALAKCVTATIHVALSYMMHPFRPRPSLANYRRFLGFSITVVLTSIARLIGERTNSFVVGSIGGATKMGEYGVAAELSTIGPSELTISVGRAMFPTLARLRNAREELIGMFLQIMGTVAMLCLPMGFGVWVIADDLVPVLLGPKWDASRELMTYLAISGMTASMVNIMLGHVMIITGHHHRQTVAQWIRCAIIAACAFVGAPFGVTGIAIGAMVAGLLMFCVAVVILKVTLSCKMSDFVAIFWRPTLAALSMALIVHYASLHMAVVPALRLALSVVLGVVSYVGVLLLLWVIAGRPQGAETATLSMVLHRDVGKRP